MPNIGGILKSGAQVLDLSGELETFDAIKTIAENWGQLKLEIDGISDLVTFLGQLDSEIEADDVQAALTKVGLGDEIGKLKAKGQKIANAIKRAGVEGAGKLLAPLSSLAEDTPSADDGLVSWSLINKEPSSLVSGALDSLDYNFDLGGNAVIAIEGGALWPYASSEVENHFIRMGVSGSLAAKANFKVPFSLVPVTGSAGGGIEGDAKTELDYYFDPKDQSQLLVSAVAGQIGHVPNPFDLDAIRRAFRANVGFYGFDLSKGGGVASNIQISVGKGLDIANVGKIAAEITFKASLVRRRQFQISLRRLNNSELDDLTMELVVSGKRNAKDTKSIGVKIVLELDELAKFVHGQLAPLAGDWDEALDTIKPFLTPGTYLQNKAESLLASVVGNLISDEEIANAIGSDIQLLLGTSEAKETEVGKYLTDRIKGTLDGLVSSVLGDAELQARSLLDGLKQRLPFFEELNKDDEILSELKKLTKKANEEFDKQIEAITNTKPKRKKIAVGLDKVGAEANRISDRADKAVAEIKTQVEHYDKIVKDALKALTDSANHKAELSFIYSKIKTDDSSVELKVTLGEAALANDYRTLLTGEFADLKRFMINTPPGLNFTKGTTLERAVEYQRSFGGEFIAFGLSADFKSVFSGKAKVKLDHQGMVSIFTKGGAMDSSTTLFGKEKTEASFIDTVTLARAKITAHKQQPGETFNKSLDLGLNLRRTDSKGLKANELAELVKDMKKFRLLSEDGADEATDALNSWIKAGSKRSVPAVIDVALPLNNEQVMRIARRGDKDAVNYAASRASTMAIAVEAIVEGRSKNAMKVHQLGLEVAATLFNMKKATDVDLLLRLGEKDWSNSVATRRMPKYPAKVVGNLKEGFLTVNSRAKDGWHLIELTEELYRVYEAIPSAPSDEELAAPWNFDRFAKAQLSIAKHTKDWLATGQKFGFFGSDGLDDRMAAFFIVLGRLAGMTRPEIEAAVTLRIQHSGDDSKRIMVA
jgi:hypothetical protein